MCMQKFFWDCPTEYVLCLCRIRKKGCRTAFCAAALKGTYLSDRMRLVGVVHMIAVHALLFGIALIEELGSDLREHCVGQHVLFLRCPLGSFSLQFVHLGSKRVGKAAGNGLLVAKDLLGELGLDGSGSFAVVAVDQTLELLGDHLVALAHDDVEHRLRTNDLAGGGE